MTWRSFPSVFILALVLPVLCGVFTSAAHAMPFNFRLTQGSKTSAGVFSGDGTLIKTLWSGVPYAAGSYIKDWDGTDDAGHLAPDGKYQVRVLTSHCTYTWEGVVGNTSDNQSGPTAIHYCGTICGMAITGTTAYIATGYAEGTSAQARFDTGTVGQKTNYILPAASMFYKVAADGTNAYWAGDDPTSSNDSFVMATVVDTDAEAIFPSGQAHPVNGYTYASAVDIVSNTAGADITGIAVQKKHPYLFVAHGGMNAVHVLNKTTGRLVQTLTLTAPGEVAVDREDNLWMILTDHGVRKAQHFVVNGDGALAATDAQVLGLSEPLALACNGAGTVLIADGGASQQVKAFDASGKALWTLGQAGGYATDPAVTNDKFDFQTPLLLNTHGTCLTYQPDGSFWVSDPGDYRTQHYSATGAFINQIAYVPSSHSVGVDPNNATRVFADFLEYKVDYSLPLGGTNASWTLVRNWRTGIVNAADYNEYFRMRFVTTLKNGRTYASVNFKLFELPLTGVLRDTGITLPLLGSLYADGSLRILSQAKGIETWSQQTLTGFDANDNPAWGTPVPLCSIQLAPSDPRNYEGFNGCDPNKLRAGTMTTGGVLISYDPLFFQVGSPVPYHFGWHLGGVRPGTSSWLWKANHSTPMNYASVWPTDGSFYGNRNSNYHYLGGPVMTVDRHIICGYGSQGSANKYQHFYEDGLFVNSFGWWYPDGATEAMAEVAIDPFSCWVVKLADGRVYMYHNDEAYHGVQRWRFDGLDTVAEQNSDVTWAKGAVTQAGLQAEYMNTPDWNNRYSVTTRVDASVNFNWGTTPPSGTSITSNVLSTRWTGYVLPQYSEAYTFKVDGDDYARVWVDGKLVLSGTGTQAGSIALTADTYYPIRVEYKNTAGAARVVLKWSSASRTEEIIPSARLLCMTNNRVNNPSDLLAGLLSDSELTTGVSGDYGWSYAPAPSYDINGDAWYVRTNMKSLQTAPPVDVGVFFCKATPANATLTRGLGIPSDTTTQWDLTARLNFEGNNQNQNVGGQFMDVLDDAGKIIARFYAQGFVYPGDYRVFGNTAVIAQTDVKTLNGVMAQWQPFHITAQNGQITFQYGPYKPVTTGLFDASANWHRAKTFRLSYWAQTGGGYLRAISMDDLTFTPTTGVMPKAN